MKKLIRAVTVSQSLGLVEPMVPNLKQKYDLQLLSSPGEKIDKICHEHKIKGHRVEMFRRLSPIKDIMTLCKLIKVFRQEKPDIIHSMTPKAGLLCMLAAWLTKVPIRIHTFTGLVWPTASGVLREILMFTDKVTCACATHIIPEGKGVMNDLQQYITKKPMKVLGYGNVRGIDMKRFCKRPEVIAKAKTLSKNDIFTYVFVGRLVKDKGINELVEAFSLLYNNYPNVRLFLVGKYEMDLDPLKSETIDRINNLPSIEAVGPKYGDELLIYYAISDCFVFPSYREGFPNTVLEAGAMELPSIVTDINGSREIIEQDVNGIIIPSKNVNALYSAMEQMLINNEKRICMGTKARSMIEQRFEQHFVQKCLYDFYDEILK